MLHLLSVALVTELAFSLVHGQTVVQCKLKPHASCSCGLIWHQKLAGNGAVRHMRCLARHVVRF